MARLTMTTCLGRQVSSQVSIVLNPRVPEVKTLYKEFWELRRMHLLARIYDEIGDKGRSN